MTLTFRHLRLRALTKDGAYGADIPLQLGLNILSADNTSGKSTCLQGLLYALGLERMLSPRREIPLTYVMTSHLEDPVSGEVHDVLESSVSVEIENASGEIVTVKRNVISQSDSKLVSVFSGPVLTDASRRYSQRDYFVLDPGASKNDAGFHRFLAEFIGWELPRVRRFDGSETLLYVETVFPLLYVEQKSGWSSIPAAFPTYLQIRDVGQRAVEFIMDLDTHALELTRQKLELELAENKASWMAKREELLGLAESVSGIVEGLPPAPTIDTDEIENAFLAISDADYWRPLEDYLPDVRRRIADLRDAETPYVEDVAEETAAELDATIRALAELTEIRRSLFRQKQIELGQLASTTKRIAALEEDLEKNRDAEKLRKFGSKFSTTLGADHCPTCSQPIHDTLLAQEASSAVMPLEENIEYIRSQLKIFLRLRERSEITVSELEKRLATATSEVNDASKRVRALRADMVAPSDSPSTASIENRLRLEARLALYEELQERFEQQKLSLASLSKHRGNLLFALKELPKDRLSAGDTTKLNGLTGLIREQVSDYGFSTFEPSEIDISRDNYRPQKEGFEIGFELSASDAIRLKWAYQLALMELSRSHETNHPGFVVFDEPRQQETAKVSFRSLLERASFAIGAGQQVIFATSEDRDQLGKFLSGLECHLLTFEGPIIRRIDSD